VCCTLLVQWTIAQRNLLEDWFDPPDRLRALTVPLAACARWTSRRPIRQPAIAIRDRPLEAAQIFPAACVVEISSDRLAGLCSDAATNRIVESAGIVWSLH
jgi:hypothetical protein